MILVEKKCWILTGLQSWTYLFAGHHVQLHKLSELQFKTSTKKSWDSGLSFGCKIESVFHSW